MDAICGGINLLADCLTSSCSVLATVLNINFIILNTLMSGVIDCSLVLASALSLIFHGILLAVEEFQPFIGEICGGVQALTGLIRMTVLGIYKMLSSISYSGYDGIADIATKVDTAFKTFVSGIVGISLGFKDFVVLVTNSVILILEFLPWSISSTLTAIFQFSAFLLKSFVTGCNRTTASINNTIKDFLLWIKVNVYCIPRDAYIGLFIILFVYFAHRYTKRRIIRVFRKMLLMLSSAVRRTILSYQHVYRVLMRCARKLNSFYLLLVQRIPNLDDSEENAGEQNAVPSDSSDNEDDGEGSSWNVSQLKKELENQKGAQMCIVCLENPKDIIFLPCRHMCACQECCDTLVYRRAPCPLCRKFIRNTIRVYT